MEKDICDKRGYHSFDHSSGFDTGCIRFESEEGDDISIIVACNECGKTAECQGTFEE
ncbi:hypothetical protein LCGC14_0687910 [marine sediment metagenome]|uniref:Uncharacterized protein n=1 Tax=marine sediment metagenome TaxID=412755 RepID=A0A0F9QLC3_9ZZZZ